MKSTYIPCSRCGEPTSYYHTRPPKRPPVCHPCRRADKGEHGTAKRYNGGCRCNACHEYMAERHRRRADRIPCVECGELTGYSFGSKAATKAPRCRKCIREHVPHGQVLGYRKGCRCDLCREAWRLNYRAYLHRRKTREGKGDPQCSSCGQALDRRTPSGMCVDCRVEERKRVARARTHRKLARAKLAQAAEGIPASPGWPFVSGPCAHCGEPFTARGPEALYCSSRCRKKRRQSRKRWISDSDRLAIYERDNWICQLCFGPVDPDLHFLDNYSATLDHIECRSWALIPDDSPSNLRLAHRICNSRRGDETWPVEITLKSSLVATT